MLFAIFLADYSKS